MPPNYSRTEEGDSIFYIKWAFKRLIRSRKRSLRIVAFLGISAGILFLFLSFRQGAKDQIDSTIKKVYGDIRVTARGEESLKEVKRYIQNKYGSPLKKSVSQLSLDKCKLTGSGNYRETTITGVDENYFQWLGDSIYWKSGGPPGSGGKTSKERVDAVLENSYASKLNLGFGDKLTISYETENGEIQELQTRISGVFIGNRFQQSGKLFLPLNRVQDLMEREEVIDLIKVILKRPTDNKLQRITSEISDRYRMKASISVRKWESKLNYGTVFSSVWALMGSILVLTALAILIVLSLGVYDTFYLDFRSRTEEISTLLTYGIGHGKLYLLTFLEVSLLLILGGGTGFLLALALARTLGNIPLVKNFSYLFIVLGGPFLEFSLFSREILYGLGLAAISAYTASLLSLRSYLRKDVARIMD